MFYVVYASLIFFIEEFFYVNIPPCSHNDRSLVNILPPRAYFVGLCEYDGCLACHPHYVGFYQLTFSPLLTNMCLIYSVPLSLSVPTSFFLHDHLFCACLLCLPLLPDIWAPSLILPVTASESLQTESLWIVSYSRLGSNYCFLNSWYLTLRSHKTRSWSIPELTVC